MSASNEQLLKQIYEIENRIKEETARGNSVDELRENLAQLRANFNESVASVTANEKLLKG